MKLLTIYYHNFWPDFNPKNENIHKFIKYTFNTNRLINNKRIKIRLYTNIIDYLNDYKNSNGDFNKITIDPPDIVLSSVFGIIHSNRIFPSSTFKLFYSGENLKIRKDYSNYKLLDKYFDVILGFDKSNSKLYPNPEKVIRLPLWILYYNDLFKEIPIINTNNENQEYNIEIQDLTKIILNNRQKYLDNNDDTSIKKRFRNNTKASFIARKTFLTQNPKNIKNIIYNTIKQVIYTENKRPIDISCPSSLFNNTQPIGNTIEDKIKHISQFMFNICPENSYSDGYTTEKIFHAYDSGCIPIYWGNNPVEKNIINPSSYIYYDPMNPLIALNKIDRLIKNENEYKKFIDNNLNPVFLDNANNEIKDIIEYAKEQINRIYLKKN